MSTQTPKLKLNKPGAGDMDWADEVNRNWDVLDDAVVIRGAAEDGAYVRMVDGAPVFTPRSPNEAALARTKTQMFACMGLLLAALIAVDVLLHMRVLKKLGARDSGGTP